MSRPMASLACIAAVLLAAFTGASGSRELLADANMVAVGAPSSGGDLGSAPVPGPGAARRRALHADREGRYLGRGQADLTNVADFALFSSASRQTAAFTNTTAGSQFLSRNGSWLGAPDVVLRANGASALLQLTSPVYDAAAKTVTFKSKILRTDTHLPTEYGVTGRYADDAANGASAGALTAPPSGALTDVALFMDVYAGDLGDIPITKAVVVVIGGGWGWGNPPGWRGGYGRRGR